jgi:hypothetical protein
MKFWLEFSNSMEGTIQLSMPRNGGQLTGTTALVGPLLPNRQYRFIGYLVSVSEALMPVSVLFHQYRMFYAALCI